MKDRFLLTTQVHLQRQRIQRYSSVLCLTGFCGPMAFYIEQNRTDGWIYWRIDEYTASQKVKSDQNIMRPCKIEQKWSLRAQTVFVDKDKYMNQQVVFLNRCFKGWSYHRSDCISKTRTGEFMCYLLRASFELYLWLRVLFSVFNSIIITTGSKHTPGEQRQRCHINNSMSTCHGQGLVSIKES